MLKLRMPAVASTARLADRAAVPRPPERCVYLLDTSYFIFRAYHALPPLSTSKGLPTNAIHGVATTLEKLIREQKPCLMGCCFDTTRDTFRQTLYPEYKANRIQPEENLQVQFPYVRRLISALQIPILDREGFEADDILATLARQYEEAGYDVILVTADKDLMQCVTASVSLLDPMREGRITEKEVLEKFGVPPRAVPDVLGLMGDSSDNIPGVKGIGQKTASCLIAHFGSVDAMLERSEEIEKIPGLRGAAGVRRKIEECADLVRLCRQLAKVRSDVPVEVEPHELQLGRLATDELERLAEELEMPRLVQRMRILGGAAESGEVLTLRAQDPAAPAPRRGSRARAAAEAAARAEQIAAAPEPESVGDWRDLGSGALYVAWSRGPLEEWSLTLASDAAVVRVHGEAHARQALQGLAAAGASLVGFDLKVLARELGAVPGRRGLDLGLASYLCDPEAGDHSRFDVVRRFLHEQPAEPGHGEAALDQVRRAAQMLEAQLTAREQMELYRALEHPLLSILAGMEAYGLLLDTGSLARMSKSLEGRMATLVERVYEAAGCEFNILSPVQLRDVLFKRLALPVKGIKTTKSGPSTDSDSLELLARLHPLPALVLEYRGMSKLKSTYVDALGRMVDGAGRIHTRLNQTVAATGRLSSSDPNLQNIPIRTEEGALIRGAFIAPDGCRLISADYNQIELRVLAHLSEDASLIEAFRSGLDIHTATSAELFDLPADKVTPSMRRDAKVVNYGIVYGMGPVRLSRELGISRADAEDYIKRYFDRYPGVRRFYGRMLECAHSNGYVATLYGRRRYLPDIASEHGGRRQLAERVATNTPIQGSAADIIKRAMVALDEALSASKLAARLVLQIHDELLLESPADQVEDASALVAKTMVQAADLLVPVVVDVGSGRSWAEAH
ncbi:MAG TPA: DNA polymerase I [Candidatus Limnocylindrales bacterium]|nr:DNA polymerase I [Candidatus Limnocylindrales bacterium]